MSYLVISDFRFGLDKRRLDLANRPGALSDLVNAHITNGGEIEKRKAFTRTSLVNPSFGLEALKDTLVVFGSAADPGGWPAGVTYQRLEHPNAASALSSVICSTVYNGKVFAIAGFADGSRFLYYDGTVLTDNVAGLLLTSPTNAALAATIAGIINGSGRGYVAVQQAFPNNHKVNVFGPENITYTVDITKVTAAGTLTANFVNAGIPGKQATQALGSFQIVAGSEAAGHQITQVSVGVTTLLTAAVPYNDSPEQTASDVALAIIANSGTSGYTAQASGNLVTIFSVATGTANNGKAVTVTSAVDVCIGLCVFALVGTGFSLDYINANGTNILSAVLNFPTPAGEALSAFLIRVRDNINAGTGGHGYLSACVGNSLYVSKAVTSSTDADISVSVSVSPTGANTGAAIIGTIVPMLAGVSTTSLSAYLLSVSGGGGLVRRVDITPAVTALVSNGVPPYTFHWEIDVLEGALSGSQAVADTPDAATTFFRIYRTAFPGTSTYPHGMIKVHCIVTDSTGYAVDSPQVTISV